MLGGDDRPGAPERGQLDADRPGIPGHHVHARGHDDETRPGGGFARRQDLDQVHQLADRGRLGHALGRERALVRIQPAQVDHPANRILAGVPMRPGGIGGHASGASRREPLGEVPRDMAASEHDPGSRRHRLARGADRRNTNPVQIEDASVRLATTLVGQRSEPEPAHFEGEPPGLVDDVDVADELVRLMAAGSRGDPTAERLRPRYPSVEREPLESRRHVRHTLALGSAGESGQRTLEARIEQRGVNAIRIPVVADRIGRAHAGDDLRPTPRHRGHALERRAVAQTTPSRGLVVSLAGFGVVALTDVGSPVTRGYLADPQSAGGVHHPGRRRARSRILAGEAEARNARQGCTDHELNNRGPVLTDDERALQPERVYDTDVLAEYREPAMQRHLGHRTGGQDWLALHPVLEQPRRARGVEPPLPVVPTRIRRRHDVLVE